MTAFGNGEKIFRPHRSNALLLITNFFVVRGRERFCHNCVVFTQKSSFMTNSFVIFPPLLLIDISWEDWAYKSSTCDVMHCRQRRHRHLYCITVWWSNLEILFSPLHHSSPFIGGLRCQAIQTEHGPYIADRTQKAVNCEMSMLLLQRKPDFWKDVDSRSPLLMWGPAIEKVGCFFPIG
jgi:hypothetical protein